MNVKLLTEYQSLRKEIVELQERIKEVRRAACYPTSPQLTGMPRAPGYSNDGIARIFEQIEELTELYTTKQIRLNDLCLQIESEIDQLPSFERRIIRLRYLDDKFWPEISEIMNVSVSQLHRIHKKIFAEFKNDAP